MSLSLYVVPTICDPLVSQPIATCIERSDSFIIRRLFRRKINLASGCAYRL